MRITAEQDRLLAKFTCVRLADESDLRDVGDFWSKRGDGLVEYLKSRGLEEDRSGHSAFYMIRNEVSLPLMFFSIRCGLLCTPMDIEGHREKLERYEESQDLLNSWIFDLKSLPESIDEDNELEVKLFNQVLERFQEDEVPILATMQKLFREYTFRLQSASSVVEQYDEDERVDFGVSIQRVNETLPSIELRHFCKNDGALTYWQELGLQHPMGEVLFWRFVVPKIAEVKKLVGCQYVYLFAGDDSEEGSLINYYNVALKFERHPDVVGTYKPSYDYGCVFMVQRIDSMLQAKEEYFEHFNRDDNDPLV